MGDFSIKPKKINKYKNINSSRKEENQNKIKKNVTPSWKEEKGNKMKPNVKSMKVGGYVNKMKDGKKVEVKDGKIIKRESSDQTLNKMKKGNLYGDLKKKYKNKQSKDSLSSAEKREINKKNREKNYKNFNFENNPEYALGLLPAGKLISKIPGVKQGISKTIGGAKNIFSKFRSDKKPSNAVAISPKGGGGQGGGKFNPPIVRPNTSKPNKPNTQIVKKRNTDIKKPNTSVVKKPNTSNVSNKPKGNIKTTGVNTRVAVPVLSSLIGKQAIAGNNTKIDLPKPKPKPKPKPIKPNKAPVAKVKTETLKKMGPTKDYTGKFVNKKGDVAYDSIGDFFSNITGTAKKRARPENRKRIQAENKGATKDVGFSGESVAKFKNPFKKNSGGILKSVPSGNKGLGKLPSPVRNKMGYMQKGGVVKMRGGGAAIRGINFNKGK